MITQEHTENRSFTLSELAGQDENTFERYLLAAITAYIGYGNLREGR